MRKTDKKSQQLGSKPEKKSAVPSTNTDDSKITRGHDGVGFDIDVEDLHSNRDRQAIVSEEIENDPGIFEN